MKAAAYARYSTDKQTENSIETQLTAITQYCQQNDISLVATYVDMAMTGTNTERPDFQRMLDGAKAKQFEAVVIYDISRGSRDVSDWFAFRKTMIMLNITVVSATEKLGDIDNPNDFLVELINVGLGQHMVLQTRQKSIAGVSEKAKQGLFLGGYPPLGYDVENGLYVVNQREAEAVRLIFGMYATGSSYNKIIDILVERGYKGKRGADIGKNALNAILQNERYIGVYFWNKRKMKYFGKWAGGEQNPEVVRKEGMIPVIIDNDTWERVQKRMKANKRNGAYTAKHTYLLSGLIECGKCGGTFTGKTNKSGKGYITRYYACNNKYRTRTCDARNINADELEAAVVIKLKEFLLKKDFDKMADHIFKVYTDSKTSRTSEKKELAQIKQKLANATKAILAGADFTELNEELAQLNVRKAELEEIIAMTPNIILTRKMIADKLKEDAQHLQDGDTARLIKSYIDKIYAHNDEVIITGGVNLNGCGGVQSTVLTPSVVNVNGCGDVQYPKFPTSDVISNGCGRGI